MAIKKAKIDSFRETFVEEFGSLFKEGVTVVEEGADISKIVTHSLFYMEDHQSLATAAELSASVRLSYPVVLVRLSDVSLTNDLIKYFENARFVFEYKGYTMVVFQKSQMFTVNALKAKFKVNKILTIKGVE